MCVHRGVAQLYSNESGCAIVAVCVISLTLFTPRPGCETAPLRRVLVQLDAEESLNHRPERIAKLQLQDIWNLALAVCEGESEKP